MNDHVAMLLAWCSPNGPALAWGLLLAGLAGSVLHCGPMCGPFVLGQVSDRLARVPAVLMCERSRIQAALLLPYHVGRLLSYAVLGAVAAQFGGLARLGFVPSALLLLGGLLFVVHGAGRFAPALRRFLPEIERAPPAWGRIVGAMARRINRTSWSGGLLLGLCLGFLPCGFLYAALAVSAATGDPSRGAVAMLAFGLGTVPSLILVGLAGQAAGQTWRRFVLAVAPAVLMGNGILLLVMAWQRLAGA